MADVAEVSRRGRPARLNREAIVAAALQSDLRTLTMRELAGRLGVTHGALYRWVADRESLLHLVGEVIVDRILPTTEPTVQTWREWLARLAWSMHDEFLAVPGYATHVAQPHEHSPHAFGQLRDRVVGAFRIAGASPEMAEQSWYVFGLSVVQWLGARQSGIHLGEVEPDFELFIDVLLRGLPARREADPVTS
ncbi:TetR/AcrR family transcriptional regulator [Microbacterium sp.]|uniref:TetR/AcrR family transcriptional regulator n=1 Tax=Microbacterium sp. TaxID=51671 RepID=UPI003C7319AA